jgi:hypothetical protein
VFVDQNVSKILAGDRCWLDDRLQEKVSVLLSTTPSAVLSHYSFISRNEGNL